MTNKTVAHLMEVNDFLGLNLKSHTNYHGSLIYGKGTDAIEGDIRELMSCVVIASKNCKKELFEDFFEDLSNLRCDVNGNHTLYY